MSTSGSEAVSQRHRPRQSRRGDARTRSCSSCSTRSLSRIAEASGHLERGEIAAKGEKIGKALAIIEALMLGLDKERGGEIAQNLERLYDYMARTLLKANLENRVDLLKEVSSLLREIKLGWDGIAPWRRRER